jgi:hypothetical protein
VKDGYAVMKQYRHSRTGAFLEGSPRCLKHGFDLTPFDIAGDGLGEDGFQGSPVALIHNHMIAKNDIVVKALLTLG